MRLLCLPREKTQWNKGGLAEIMVDKIIIVIMIQTIIHFSDYEQSLKVVMGNNQLNTAQKLVASYMPITFLFFLNPKNLKQLHIGRVD